MWTNDLRFPDQFHYQLYAQQLLSTFLFQSFRFCLLSPQKGGGEGLDCPKGWGTDVVLHAFDVIMNHVLVEAQESEEIGEQLVPPRNIAGESLASDRQNQSAILLVFEEPITVEALDHVR